ncbi:glutamate--tRNA ligase [Albimonas sp. CAU 1670]|uniref:glutamate--tRNA ligase n=1 Tax=Albimonas sp. CAU 1670 TaxID=3032599 RepID=UPI0023DAAAC3|nr:glutamate--tRNA ligase [Albimonas sp. CAU 1670]MDF2233111.1 glutamate--tRNA ligase [Albimonas sp. CAU 1670]
MTLTRFAPSPTGFLHLGNLRAAFFNWAIARRAGGRFVLRIDDTDAARSEERYVEAIREDLDWLGLDRDAELRQSERLDRYAEAAERLKASGRLYPCWETPDDLALKRRVQLSRGLPPVYDRAALALGEAEKARLAAERPPHWRFKLERQRVEWIDGILGPVSIDAASVSDPVLIREDGQVLYTLASSVDDAEMGVTDVVRGADHVTNTAAQVQIMRALGAEAPRFAHHSLLTGPEGEAFSKRAEALSLRALRAQGLEPMALLSLIARLGSADPVEPRQTPAELAEGFDVTRFGTAPTRLDAADLGPLSEKILHAMPYEAAAPRLAALGVANPEALWAAVHANLTRFDEIAEWDALLREGTAPVVAPEDRAFVAQALAALPPKPWTEATWGEWTGALKAATGRKGRGLFLPLRRALTGRDRGPEMAALMPLMSAPAPQPGEIPAD